MHHVAICAIFKNEAEYLYEWLSFHTYLGVTGFFLYNNNSTDDSLSVIESWPGPASVQVIDWPQTPGQDSAYTDMIERNRSEAEWCAFIDCDEFICPQTGKNIPSTLDMVDLKATALFAHWRLFGSSGSLTRKPGLVTERFTKCADDSFEPHSVGKSIVKLASATTVSNCHIVRTSGQMLNDLGDEVSQDCNGIHDRSSHNLFAVNHYFTKSLEEWRHRRRMGRADKNPDAVDFRRDEEQFHSHDQNVLEDLTAFQITQRMKPLFYP